jgi:hypothetical protein
MFRVAERMFAPWLIRTTITDRETVLWKNLSRYGEAAVCTAHGGWLSDTLARGPVPYAVRVAFIDCDLANGTYEVLLGVVPSLVEDGWIFSQDFHIPRVRQCCVPLLPGNSWERLRRSSREWARVLPHPDLASILDTIVSRASCSLPVMSPGHRRYGTPEGGGGCPVPPQGRAAAGEQSAWLRDDKLRRRCPSTVRMFVSVTADTSIPHPRASAHRVLQLGLALCSPSDGMEGVVLDPRRRVCTARSFSSETSTLPISASEA